MSALASVGASMIEMFIGAIPGLLSASSYARKVIKEKDQERQEAFKMSQQIDTTDLSDKLYSDIRRMSRGSIIMEVAFTTTAIRTTKFIKYALYYLVDDNAKRIVMDEMDQRFVNSIAEMCGVQKIYPEMDSLNLADYDSTNANHKYKKAYLLDLADLEMKVSNPEFIKLVKARAGRTSILDTGIGMLPGTVNGIIGRLDDDGLIHPIFFKPTDNSSQNYMKRQSAAISDKTFNKFENAFYNIFGQDDKYYYSTDEHGCYTLNIVRQNAYNAVDTYIIDDGSILGGTDVSILVSYMLPNDVVDKVFVNMNIANQDLIRKILNNRFYIMNKDEAMEAIYAMFNNAKIYHYVDFSDTDWFSDLTPTDRTILERKLGQIIQVINDVRVRFNSFAGVGNFVLVSDKQCRSQLSYDGTTSRNIEEGLVISVVDNSLTITHQDGQTQRYNLV